MRIFHRLIPHAASAALFALVSLSLAVAPALAAQGVGGYDPLHPQNVVLDNGRVYWDVAACKGTCTAQDVDPNALGLPLRPWQRSSGQTMKWYTVSLLRGIQIAYINQQGQASSYIGLGQTVCLNYTAADAQQAGGVKNLDIAYYDPTIENCDNSWNGGAPSQSTCQKKVYGNWYPINTFRNTTKYPNPIVVPSPKADGSGELCTGMRLAATYALASVQFGQTPTATPVQPTPPPTPAPTATPAPAAAAPAATPVTAIDNVSRGLHGEVFYVENRTVAVGDQIWFDFKVTNNSPYSEKYGILSIHSDYGLSGQSWSNSTFNAFSTLEWRDHIQVYSPGLYPFYLGICYSSREECYNNQAPWERLSPDVLVAVDAVLPPTGYSSRGIRGDYFYVENLFPQGGQPIWFDFRVTNTTGGDVPYGVLSVIVSQVTNGLSWTSQRLKPNEVLTWRDHIGGFNAGLYAFYLGICYAPKDDCDHNPAIWDRLSDNVYVTVQP